MAKGKYPASTDRATIQWSHSEIYRRRSGGKEDCSPRHKAYLDAADDSQRLMNQSFSKKILIGDGLLKELRYTDLPQDIFQVKA
ncbi:MAG: hypothetical protein ACYC5A_03645 [Thermoleophilia bacterium]